MTVVAGYCLVVEVAEDTDTGKMTKLASQIELLEIIDPRGAMLEVGTPVATSLGGPDSVLPPDASAGEEFDDSASTTIVSGEDIKDAYTYADRFQNPTVVFQLTDDGATASTISPVRISGSRLRAC